MKAFWQVVCVGICCTALISAEEKSEFAIQTPKVTRSMFSQELGMLDSERDEYATNLASFAANQVAASQGAVRSAVEVRRLLGLALHLSPRNKRAVVVSFQISKGVLPEVTEGNYTPQVFARLLLTRGQLLEKQAGAEDKKLARFFIQLAAELDPRNEDAVYASEVHRLDQGEVDWSAVTDPSPETP